MRLRLQLRLQTKLLASVGIIIFLVLGISTSLHIQSLKQNYLGALELRSEALARGMLDNAAYLASLSPSANIQKALGTLSTHCSRLYDANKEKNIAHVAVIGATGVIAAHNNINMQETPLENPLLLKQLQRQELTTTLDGDVYHTFVPIFGTLETFLGVVDIGVPKRAVDTTVQQLLLRTGGLFVLFVIFAFLATSVLVHVVVTRPIRQLVTVSQKIAKGELVDAGQTTEAEQLHANNYHTRDEIGALTAAFSDMMGYLQDMAHATTRIAVGDLSREIAPRSKLDVLGNSTLEMLRYLRYIAEIATNMAGGDLREDIQARSDSDAFGKAIYTMARGLRTLIAQIRNIARQITGTGQSISELSAHDIRIVEEVHTAAETMTSTMQEVGSSVEEVANNMNVLSSSVEMTSASVSQMTSSIAHIAGNTNELTEQTQRTINYLEETISSLKEIVSSTDESKQLSQEAIQEALHGQAAVEQVAASMATIEQTITTSVNSMTRFEQRSHDIDQILDVIQNITDQTSLLALNASIIAAQAGSHGRGFAVVADEIRELATGVGTSTKDIAAIVHALQQDTQEVVQTIRGGAEDVNQGMERTQQAREVLEKIIASAQRSSSVVTDIAGTLHGLMDAGRTVSESMERVNMMTNDITAATNEQEASTQQINQAVTHINEMASQIQRATTEQSSGVRQVLQVMDRVTQLIEQNLDSSQQITNTTRILSSQAGLLLDSVDRFTLP